MTNHKHTLHVVGVGPGMEGLLTEAARGVIGACRCFAGGRRLLELAPEGAETHAISSDLEATRRFIAANLERGDVCVLASGDPGCFSIMPFLEKKFTGCLNVVPGIASVQIMSARLRLPWQDWRLLSLHGRDVELPPLPDPAAPTVYFCDAYSSPQAIAASLPPALGGRLAVVGSNLGLPDERVWKGRLGDAVPLDFPGNSLMMVFPEMRRGVAASAEQTGRGVAADAEQIRREAEGYGDGTGAAPQVSAPGIPDDLWLRRESIPLSKSEVRAVLLSKAQPRGRRVIWDSGAGTGSYGIECSLLEPAARVYSLDKNPEACEVLAENARRFGAVVEAVCAEAPDCFTGLPAPDLVIIGGNDGRLEAIFKGALTSLAPGGRLVVTALLDETKRKAHGLFAASGLENRSATRVAISRGEAKDWVEQNPVIIFTGDKPAANTHEATNTPE